ncbi:MAG TPA: hypothetical protein VGK41_00390 [Solirubrobacterales bacterium]
MAQDKPKAQIKTAAKARGGATWILTAGSFPEIDPRDSGFSPAMSKPTLPPSPDPRQLELPGFLSGLVEQCPTPERPRTLRQRLRKKAQVPMLFAAKNDNDQCRAQRERLRKAGYFELFPHIEIEVG